MTRQRALISLTRFSETTELVCETLESLAALEGTGFSVRLFDQRPDGRLDQAVGAFSTDRLPIKYQTIPARSLSYARNCAISAAADVKADIVLYIDADAVADPKWAMKLCAAMDAEPNVAMVGARIIARWRSPAPLLSKARFVCDQFSLLDLGIEQRRYHRVVGAGFGLHRTRLGAEARFDETLGRRDGRLFSGEESELCTRALAAGWDIHYNGAAVIHHQIMPQRAKTWWIMKRFYYAGWSRARVGGAPSPSHGPRGAEWIAVAFLAIPYLCGCAIGSRNRRKSGTD